MKGALLLQLVNQEFMHRTKEEEIYAIASRKKNMPLNWQKQALTLQDMASSCKFTKIKLVIAFSCIDLKFLTFYLFLCPSALNRNHSVCLFVHLQGCVLIFDISDMLLCRPALPQWRSMTDKVCDRNLLLLKVAPVWLESQIALRFITRDTTSHTHTQETQTFTIWQLTHSHRLNAKAWGAW